MPEGRVRALRGSWPIHDPRASAPPPRAPQVLTCTPASPALQAQAAPLPQLQPLMSCSTSSWAWGLEEGKAHVTEELVCTCERVHLVEGNPGTQHGVGGWGVDGHLGAQWGG